MRTNAEIADMLEEIATLLAFDDANPFRVRAYRNGARTIRRYGKSMASLVADGADLTALPTIGTDLSALIEEVVNTGRMRSLDALRIAAPIPSLDLLEVEGIGPKKARALWQELGISTPEQLHRAVLDQKVRSVSGFGPASEMRLAEVFAKHTPLKSRRYPLGTVMPIADSLRTYLGSCPDISRFEIAGSFRRGRDTVGDLDIVAETQNPDAAIAHIVDWSRVERVVLQGDAKATVVLEDGLQVDLRTTATDGWGAMLHYFTGSKAHSIAMRIRAKAKGLKLNEYGVWQDGLRIAGTTEKEIFDALGLAFIPPELREDRGEIELAAEDKLPILVTRQDLKGDLHVIANSPGDVDGLLQAAHAQGLSYVAIGPRVTARTQRASVDEIFKEVEARCATIQGLKCFRLVETGITAKGDLDVPDALLSGADVVVGAVRDGFDLSKSQQTARLARAVTNPNLSILSHPSGRKPGKRAPFDIDMTKLAKAATKAHTALELSADPARMDLTDLHCHIAQAAGTNVSVTAEATRPEDFERLTLGIVQARRGWLGPMNVLNTRSARQVAKAFRAPIIQPQTKEPAHAGRT
jgi:DNA polymerase (family X)